MERDLEAYEALLQQHGISVPRDPNSRIQHAILFDRDLRETLGLVDLAQKVLRVRDHDCFHTLVPHLRFMHHDSPARQHVQAVVSQNSPSVLGFDDVGNRSFELYLATLVMCFAKHIALEAPTNGSAKTRNPDLLCRLWQQCWAVACKVLASHSQQTYLDNVIRAAEQIRASEADLGFVCLNLRNILPHDELLRVDPDSSTTEAVQYVVYEDPGEPYRRVKRFLNARRSIYNAAGIEELRRREFFRDARVAPSILHFISTLTRVRSEGEIRFQPLTYFYEIPLCRLPSRHQDDRMRRFGPSLNRWAQWGSVSHTGVRRM